VLRTVSVLFERLEPSGAPRPPGEWLRAVRPRERAGGDRPFLFLNMVATVDGRATRGGRAAELGSDADTLLLVELRAIADAVLIGTGTVRAEGYGKLVSNADRIARRTAEGLAPTPVAVLISRSFDVPWGAPMFASPEQPVIVYTSADGEPPAVAAPLELVRSDDVSPAAVVADLRRRGVRALLCEGGPTLNRGLLAAGVVDELFLTLSPLLTGEPDALQIVVGDVLGAPVELALEWMLRHEQELYLRYAVRR
jgi:riboflavin biosynthesis pyrimidine reductase